MHTLHPELFLDFQVPEPHARADFHLDTNNLYGFGSDPLSNPFYPQRTTDWGHSGIDPSAIQMPSSPWVEARQSPHFPIPSQTHSSSQSDSDRLSPCSAATSLSPPHTTTPQPPLEEKRRKIMTECAPAPPVVRNAVSSVVNSLEWQSQGDIHSDLLMPIVEPIHFANGGRSGSRGGIDCYRCRFGLCTKVIKRRDHMLNHVRCHLGLKPWVCAFISVDAHKQCETRFLRIDDLKRHLRHLHKHDMDENGNYFPVPNRMKQVRGPRKNRRADPYPAHDTSDDEYRPCGAGYGARRGRAGLFGRRYGPHGLAL